MTTVQIIQMGPLAHVFRIDHVAKTANKAQSYYTLTVGDKITSLGDPQDGKYTARHLLQILLKDRDDANIDMIVGVVDSPIYDDLFSAVDEANKCIIISTQANNIQAIVTELKTNLETYVLVEIAAQLLAIEYRRATNNSADPEDCAPPWHQETKSCVFDYSDTFKDTGKKLIAPRLCESCTARLAESNIRHRVQNACMRIVDLAVRPKLYTLTKDVLENRVIVFLFSGWLGMILADLLTPHISLWILSLVILSVVAIGVFIQYRKIPSMKL